MSTDNKTTKTIALSAFKLGVSILGLSDNPKHKNLALWLLLVGVGFSIKDSFDILRSELQENPDSGHKKHLQVRFGLDAVHVLLVVATFKVATDPKFDNSLVNAFFTALSGYELGSAAYKFSEALFPQHSF